MPPSSLYRALVRLGAAGVSVAGRWNAKAARGHAGRRGSAARLIAWARQARELGRPLVWVHAPSVGEGLQAHAVLDRLRARHPEWQAVYTHFSPSAERLAARMPADVADYLPYDLPSELAPLLQALAPDALVFAKLDLWPELAIRAAALGAAVLIVAGTVSPVSRRTRWPARALLRPGYASITAAGAVSEADRAGLVRLGVHPDRITVLGDPRFDSVMDVVGAVPADEPLHRFGEGAATLVAGSTWPPDEAVLLDAFRVVRDRHASARLILVPHEPTPRHLEGVAARARRLGLPAPVRLSEATSPAPLLLVDRVGVLARLYGGGRIAWVGGGFGRSGLHSVLEPAAWGLPVVFGPRWQSSREAGLLLEAGAAVALPPGRHEAAEALAARWSTWIANDGLRLEAGRSALRVVRDGLGAAERNAELVARAVGARASGRESR